MRLCVATIVVGAFASAACGSSPASPDPVAVDIPAGTHRSPIVAMAGTGAGGVSVTPKPIATATFAADIIVSVERARPNTMYFVQRAPEIGRALGSDGVCQRASATSPWSSADPAAPAFVTFQQANAGPTVTMTTSASGSASLAFEFLAPTIAAGTLFDVMFRLVDNESVPTTELRSGCFTVVVR